MDFPQAAIFVDGVVAVNYAENVHLKNCEFTWLGGTAVKFGFGVKNSSVENCYFENIAATAVYAGGENCLPEGDEGIFVAGDCRTKTVRQVTTATADGAVAALSAIRYIDSL